MNPLERTAREHLAAGRFRKARDDFKSLCKKDRPRYLPLLIEANVGLARQMIDTGFLENAAQVIDYLREIAPAAVITDLELRLATAKGGPLPTSLRVLELLSQPNSTLTPETRLQCADDLVLTFAPVSARTPAESALATDIHSVQTALAELSAGNFEAANRLITSIARNSAVSHWRLFIKGLIAFQSNNPAKAIAAFDQLPGRCVPAQASETYRAILGEKLKNPTEPAITAACHLIGQSDIAQALTKAELSWLRKDWLGSYDFLRSALPEFPSRDLNLSGILSEFYFKSVRSQPLRAFDRLLNQFTTLLDRRKTKNVAEEAWMCWCLAILDPEETDSDALYKNWTRFIELDKQLSGSSPTRESKAWTWIGNALAENETPHFLDSSNDFSDEGRAIQAFMKAAVLDPTDPVPCLQLCDLYEDLDKYPERNRLLDSMVEQFPRNKDVVLMAGNSCYERKAYRKASSYYELAHQLNPLDHKLADRLVDCRNQLACDEYKNGKPDAGRASLALNTPLLSPHSDNLVRSQWHHDTQRAVLELLWGNAQDGKNLLSDVSTRQVNPIVLSFFVHLTNRRLGSKKSKPLPEANQWLKADVSALQGVDLLLCLRKLKHERDQGLFGELAEETKWLNRCAKSLSSRPLATSVARDLVEAMAADSKLQEGARSILAKQDPSDLFFKLFSHQLLPPKQGSVKRSDTNELYQSVAEQAKAQGDLRTAQLASKFLELGGPSSHGNSADEDARLDDFFGNLFEDKPSPKASKHPEDTQDSATPIPPGAEKMFRELMLVLSLLPPEEVRRNPPPGMSNEMLETLLEIVETEKARSKAGGNPFMPKNKNR